jgi:prolyl-tRNA synthetase
MGSYGIGVGRNLATVVEASHDDKGIVWPTSIAPYEVVVTIVKSDDAQSITTAECVYAALRANGVDTIVDDRDERPGVKFADAELIGIPYRITIGPRGLAEGVVEVVRRATGP